MGTKALSESSMMLEGIDPLMVKCCMIQLVNYMANRGVSLKSLSIVNMDTLSRRAGKVSYHAAPPAGG